MADTHAARAAGKIGALSAVECGDFLEGRPEGVAQAHADGVRSITVKHCRNGELGDIITGAPRAGARLTDAGIAVVKAMNQAGVLIDVAHAAPATAMGAIAASSRPVMASHVHIHAMTRNPRFISLHMAKVIAEKGGTLAGKGYRCGVV